MEQDFSAFQTVLFYDTTVIVHAHDFLNNILRMSGHSICYGGDYLTIKEEFLKALTFYNKCNIRPLFVFGGGSPLKVFCLNCNFLNFEFIY